MKKIKYLLLLLALCFATSAFSQQKALTKRLIHVTGKVTDNSGKSIPGVTIIVKGTTRGTITNVNGDYSLSGVPADATLNFSFVGMQTKDIKVNNRTKINITLAESATGLNQVVVVGYGTQKRSDITGSVETVSVAHLAKIPAVNAMSALEGAVSGVNITTTSAIPGATPSLVVNGTNSINASTSPLIVVDGIPFQGSMNYINPNDIASMEVLKGPSAVAIYGTRGTNGVILIQTKQGRKGKPTITYSGYAGVEGMEHALWPRGGAAYVAKYKAYISETGQNYPYGSDNPVPNLYEVANYKAGKTINPLKAITRTGFIQSHNLSISGGAKNIKYYVSGNYTGNKGIVKGYNYKREGVRTNFTANVTNFLKTGLNMFVVSNNYDGNRANVLDAEAMSPYAQLRNTTTGKLNLYPMYPELLYKNPLINNYNSHIDRRVDINGSFYGLLSFPFIPVLKGLTYRINISDDYNPIHQASYTSRAGGSTDGGDASIYDSRETHWIIENIVKYSRDFGKNHIGFTGLYSAQKDKYSNVTARASGFINDILTFNDLAAGATASVASYADQYTMVSQMARLNYSYNNLYLLTATIRRDGYSAFGANTSKFGAFPSVAVGWNIANEKFMKGTRNFLDQLKLRLAVGRTGNMAIGVNQTETTDASVLYPFDGMKTIGVLASVLGNANLHWESTLGADAGIDFSLKNGRYTGSVDVYDKHTTDLLMRRNIPQITGYSSVWDNLGKLRNIGVNVTLKTTNILTSNFRWSTRISFSSNKNTILDLYGDKKSDIGNRWFIGHPIGVIYDYKLLGVWQESQAAEAAKYGAVPGDLHFADLNGDGKIDANDKEILGQTSPKWYGGITNSFSYKNFELSIFIQTSQGGMKNNVTLNYADEAGRRNTPTVVGYWTPTNKSNKFPSLAYHNTYGYGYPMKDNYTRIKNVTLSYSLPETLLRKTFLKSATLYVSGRNLYTFTKWIGWDPEQTYFMRGVYSGSNSWGGNDWTNNYPPVRYFVFGFNVSLK